MADLPLLLHGATGRMGRAVRECLVEFPEIRLCACVASRKPAATGPAAGPIWLTPEELETHRRREALPDDLVILDFSLAAGTALLVKTLASWPRAIVAASTGLDPATESKLDALATRVPVLRAPNLSLGNAVALALLRALPPLARTAFAFDIVEHHHADKKDAPSGTALALARILGGPAAGERPAGRTGGNRAGGEARIHSIRAGSVPGTHRVILSGAGETLELVHTVNDRAVFARGALRAVQFLHGKAPGRYGIEHLLAET